jgi:hypothetical protein
MRAHFFPNAAKGLFALTTTWIVGLGLGKMDGRRKPADKRGVSARSRLLSTRTTYWHLHKSCKLLLVVVSIFCFALVGKRRWHVRL